MSKAERIFYSQRFTYKRKDYVDAINEIIGRLNSLHTVPENIKTIQCRQYAIWQQQLRETSFSNKEDILRGLAHDAILMESLYQGNIGEMDLIYFLQVQIILLKYYQSFTKKTHQELI